MRSGRGSGNSRNGKTTKTLKGEFGEIELDTPRDRNGEFEPKLVRKHQTRWTGFDDKILSMYAPGMTTRDIQLHLKDMYGVEVSPTLISEVTDQVMEQALGLAVATAGTNLSNRIVFLDALFVKMRHHQDTRIVSERRSRNQAALHGCAEHRSEMAHSAVLARGAELLRDEMGRPHRRGAGKVLRARLKAHQPDEPLTPLRRPSAAVGDIRTVLARKGPPPLRRNRRALAGCALF
jgi:hypothetical protein